MPPILFECQRRFLFFLVDALRTAALSAAGAGCHQPGGDVLGGRDASPGGGPHLGALRGPLCGLDRPALGGGGAGRGALLTGDTIQVVADRRSVSFMWSYVNLIPLSAAAVRAIVAAVAPFEYDRIYSGWRGAVVASEAQAAVARSAERYLQAIAGER